MEKEQAIQEYVLAKNAIQLTNAVLEECHVVKSSTLDSVDNTYNDLKFGYSVLEAKESQVEAILKVMVRSTAEDGTNLLELNVSYRGTFSANTDVDLQDLIEFTEVQTVPQLLPYARTLIVSVTAQMGIEPITLPTMDIIHSIMNNAESSNAEELD